MKITPEFFPFINMNNLKPFLAVETSQNSCSACVYFSEQKFFEQSFELKHSHAEKIFELIDAVIKSAGIKLSEIKSAAVSSGPGSFTGLRIGMSAVKAIAFALSVPVIPVPTFDAFALQITGIVPVNSQFIIANRVNSEEIFYAKFKNSAGGEYYSFVEELQIISKNELPGMLNGSFLFGNAFVNLPIRDSVLVKNEAILKGKAGFYAPGADFIARWAEQFGSKLLTYRYEYLEPNYLKDFIIKEKEKKL